VRALPPALPAPLRGQGDARPAGDADGPGDDVVLHLPGLTVRTTRAVTVERSAPDALLVRVR
jgi:hypothetical protein